jgi:hypothetical protein
MTETYEASLAELSRRIAGRRARLEEERCVAEARKKQLQGLLQRMTTLSTAFDEEDCEHVRKQIAVHEARLDDLARAVQEEESKRREREQLFHCMVGAINDRTRVLEQDDDCLSAHPEMLHFFARKQLSLQSLLRAKMEESLEEGGESCARRKSTCPSVGCSRN